MTWSPVGSIIAFGGNVTRKWEDQHGWLRCDGRLLDSSNALYEELFNVIQFAWGGDGDTMFNIPDLQGFFLRGVDMSRDKATPDLKVPFPADPDRDRRVSIRPGGNKGPNVGSAQIFATARPRGPIPFTTDIAGEHSHSMNLEVYASRDTGDNWNTVASPFNPQVNLPWPSTELGGNHLHEILGGDKETRPLNAYVHWIIRYGQD
jgi:hypothetical protein